MTTAFAPPSVRIRPPLWTRLYFVGFGVIWTGVLVASAVEAPHAAIPSAAAMLAFGALIIWSRLHLGVTATDDHLVVHNRITTSRLTRSEIEGFREGPAPNQGLPFSHCVYALTRDGRVLPLVVTSRLGLRGPSAHVRDDVADLQRWLDAPAAVTGS